MAHVDVIEQPTGFTGWPTIERQDGSFMDVAFFTKWRERLEQLQHVAPCWPVDHTIVPAAGQTALLGIWQDLTNLVGLSPTKLYIPPYAFKLMTRFRAGLNYDWPNDDSVKISFRWNVNEVYSAIQTIHFQPDIGQGVDGTGIAGVNIPKSMRWPDLVANPDGVPLSMLDTVQSMKLEYRFDILLGSGGDPIQKFFFRNDFASSNQRPWYWFMRPLTAAM